MRLSVLVVLALTAIVAVLLRREPEPRAEAIEPPARTGTRSVRGSPWAMVALALGGMLAVQVCASSSSASPASTTRSHVGAIAFSSQQ